MQHLPLFQHPMLDTPIRRIFKDDAMQMEFIEKGYVIIPLLEEESIQSIFQELQETPPADQFDPESNPVNPFHQSSYHCTFLDTNLDYKAKTFDISHQYYNPLIEKHLADFRILSGNFYVKMPGKGLFEIHQNWPVLQDLQHTSLTIWCPLVDVNEVNGTIHIVEGSHKIVPDVAAVHLSPFFADFEEALVNKYMKPVNLKAGEGIIFCDSLIHYSPANHANTPRYAMQITVIPQECKPVHFHYNPEQPELGIEMLHMDADFYKKSTIADMIQRPDLSSLGFIQNENQLISESVFQEKLNNGLHTRLQYYAGQHPYKPVIPSSREEKKKGFFNRIFQRI